MKERIFSCRSWLFWIPQFLSFSRALLAVLLALHVVSEPMLCLVWAVLSDVLDGYLARLFHVQSRLGAYLDPSADKLFALSFVYYYYETVGFSFYELLALFARDISLILFWLYLLCSKKLHGWRVQSFFMGKVATSLQFLAFGCMAMKPEVPEALWWALGITGLGALVELCGKVL